MENTKPLLTELQERARETLGVPCINSSCDEKGTITGSDGGPEQCQFCFEYRFPLLGCLDSIIVSTVSAVEEAVEKRTVGELRHSIVEYAKKTGQIKYMAVYDILEIVSLSQLKEGTNKQDHE